MPTAFAPPSPFGPADPARPGGSVVASVRAHPVLIAIVTLVAVLAGVAWSSMREPTYSASAQVLVTPIPEAERSLPQLPLLRASSDRTRIVQTAASLLDSPAAASLAARRLGGDWTGARVDGIVDVLPVGDSDVLAVTAKAADAAVAARVANAYADAALHVRARELAPLIAARTAETERRLAAEPDPSSPTAVDLAERLSSLRALGTDGDPTLSLIRVAARPRSPTGPSATLIALLSLLGGLVIGVGAAMALDMLSPPRLATAGEAVSATGLPVLVRVPSLPPWARAGSPLRGRPAASAALRTLQHQLALEEVPPSCLLLTGGSLGDGVTTTVAELGHTLARTGYSVLVVDLDPRGHGLAARLGVTEPDSLLDVLGRGQGFDAAVAAVPSAPGLHLLAMGAQGPLGIPDDVASALRDALAQAKATTFDYVLVDAPPPAESAHALQVADAVDAVVLVLRPGRTRLTDVETGLATLNRAARRPLGLVIVGGRGPAPPPDPAPAVRQPENARRGTARPAEG